jgi:hypothetical protein
MANSMPSGNDDVITSIPKYPAKEIFIQYLLLTIIAYNTLNYKQLLKHYITFIIEIFITLHFIISGHITTITVLINSSFLYEV